MAKDKDPNIEHARGQSDYVSGTPYKPPKGVLRGMVTSGEESQQDIAENKAYPTGFVNAREQDPNA